MAARPSSSAVPSVSAISMRSTDDPRPNTRCAPYTSITATLPPKIFSRFSSLSSPRMVNAFSPSMACKPSLLPITQPCPAAKDRVMRRESGWAMKAIGSISADPSPVRKSQGRMAASPVMSNPTISSRVAATSVSARASITGLAARTSGRACNFSMNASGTPASPAATYSWQDPAIWSTVCRKSLSTVCVPPLERHRDAETQGNAHYRQGVSLQVLPGVGPTDETQQLHGVLSPNDYSIRLARRRLTIPSHGPAYSHVLILIRYGPPGPRGPNV